MKSLSRKAGSFGMWAMLLPLLMLSACATHQEYLRDAPRTAPQNPCGEGQIRFFVVDQDGGDIGGVAVSVVTNTGIEQLGVTDSLQADLCVENAVLSDPAVKCILFCREGYFCGALLPRPDLVGYWELMIALARRAVS